MRYAIISDIHGNLEALQRVLAEIQTQKVDEILCLGDVIGYGPNPNECVDIIRETARICLAGNHDYAPLGKLDISYFNQWARSAIEWTAEELTPSSRDFLLSLPLKEVVDGFTIVHSTPLHPNEWNYITTLDEAEENYAAFDEELCFIGHSHVPLIVIQNEDGKCDVENDSRLQLVGGNRYIINVGSVGQPRDFNPRAAYSIYDDNDKVFQLWRVEYDVGKTQDKIIRAGLPEFLADRLARGQ